MKAMKTLLATSLLAAALPSMAGTILLDFEDLTLDSTRAQNYVNQSGQAWAASVLFSENAWVIKSASAGGDLGNFYNLNGSINRGALMLTADPDPDPDNLPTPAESFTVRIDGGFNSFSMNFTGEGSVSVLAYNAAGTRIGSSGGPAPVPGPQECLPNYACKWAPLSIDLGDEKAAWITVSGTDGKFYFDDLLFVADEDDGNPPVDVPEPGGVALSLAALGALAWSRKRRA